LFCWSLSMIDYFLDELVDEHEEEQINAEEDAGGEQWFDFIHPSVFNLVSLFVFICFFILSSKIKYKNLYFTLYLVID
jgi:hypothetical protein